MLTLSAIVLSGGLLALAAARGPVVLFAAWAVLGAGMALGLYDAAFATLTTIYTDEARGPITWITLIAGFASTVSWPVSSLLDHAIGWRGTCVVWAALNLVVSLPLIRVVLHAPTRLAHLRRPSNAGIGWNPRREMILLAYAFAATWFVTGSIGGTPPAAARASGRHDHAGDRRGRADGAGPGRRADRRVRPPAARPPARLGAHRGDASVGPPSIRTRSR